MEFRCYFGITLNHSGFILNHFSALGDHWAPPASQDASGTDSGCIWDSLWEPVGHPSGSLFSPFGCPEGPRSERNDASESICSRARFFIGFSSLFSCLGPLSKDSVWERCSKSHFRPTPKKTRFVIGFSPLSECLGPLKTLIPI